MALVVSGAVWVIFMLGSRPAGRYESCIWNFPAGITVAVASVSAQTSLPPVNGVTVNLSSFSCTGCGVGPGVGPGVGLGVGAGVGFGVGCETTTGRVALHVTSSLVSGLLVDPNVNLTFSCSPDSKALFAVSDLEKSHFIVIFPCALSSALQFS